MYITKLRVKQFGYFWHILNIVTSIKNGDHLGFQQVFNEYHKKLYVFVLNKTESEYLAEEVVQIAFIKLWSYRNSLNEEYAISTQLFRIATTTLIDLLRKQSNDKDLIKELTRSTISETINPNDELNEKELVNKMAAAISEMPTIQRKVFELSRLEGMTYKQIAESLTISVKTVEVHISKALKRIRKQLPFILLIVFPLLFYFFKSKG